jgi:hypothetical protein
MTSPRRINVSIDRLVLRGIGRHDAVAVTASLKAELARALAEPAGRDASLQPRVAPVLRLGSVPLDAGRAGARRFGTSIARAIVKGVAR